VSVSTPETARRDRDEAKERLQNHMQFEGEVPQVPEREFFIDNLLVRIHLIIEMILVDRPCAMGV